MVYFLFILYISQQKNWETYPRNFWPISSSLPPKETYIYMQSYVYIGLFRSLRYCISYILPHTDWTIKTGNMWPEYRDVKSNLCSIKFLCVSRLIHWAPSKQAHVAVGCNRTHLASKHGNYRQYHLIFSVSLSYFLFIFYLLRCTLPDFPSVSSLAPLPFLSCCYQTTTTQNAS